MKKQRKHKWKYQINVKKKIIVLVILGVSLFVGLGYAVLGSNLGIFGSLEIEKFDKTLYGVIKKDVNKGYAAKYTGSHQDSMDSTKSTEEIYHYYAASDDNTKGSEIDNRNNLVFAGTCWKMIRTTDTGGVRILYNGEAMQTEVDGEIKYDCGSTRPYHLGSVTVRTNFSGSYKYSNSYTKIVSGSTTTFTLDDPQTITVNSTTADTAIPNIAQNYKYTCRNSSDTCTNAGFYEVEGQSDGTYAYAYKSLTDDTIGATAFSSLATSPSDVGYMYGNRYELTDFSIKETITMNASTSLNTSNITSYGSYYFGDGYILSGNDHVLTNPTTGSSITDNPESWENMYYCNNSTSSTCATMYYVNDVTSDSTPLLYYTTIESGKEVNDTSYKYLFADNIIDNGDGTFTMDTPEEVLKKDWYSKYNNLNNKYVCMPGYYTYDSNTSTYICSDNGAQQVGALRYVSAVTAKNFTVNSIYKFGNSFEVSGTNYKLKGITGTDNTLEYVANWSSSTSSNCMTSGSSISTCGYKSLSNSHYTCFNLTGECATYNYVYYTTSNGGAYIPITGEKYVSTDLTDTNNVFNEMFKQNTNDSKAKIVVDSWYRRNLLNTVYESIIDDTIYCNNRVYTGGVGWNPNGGDPSSNNELHYKEYDSTKDLSCENITDRFSVSNNDAKLTYKAALMSFPEMDLLGNNNIRKSSGYYWTMSPYRTGEASYYGAYNRLFYPNGSTNYWYSSTERTIKPAISLVKGVEYVRGTGKVDDPYIVEVEENNP